MPNINSLKQSTKTAISMVFLFVLLALAYFFTYSPFNKTVDSFDSCVAANGGQIQLSYPGKCTYKGMTFVQEIEDVETFEEPKTDEEVDETITPSEPNVSEIPDQEPIVKPAAEIHMGEPRIVENDDYIDYTYFIYLNSTAMEDYGTGIRYEILAPACNREGVFNEGKNRLIGSLVPTLGGNNPVNLPINKDYLKSKSELVNSTYSLFDTKGNLIITSATKIPSCYEVNEYNKKGEFKIKLTEVNRSLVSGKVHFEWDFIMDDDADELLEKGFRSKMNHSCSDYVDDKYKKSFEEDWNAGKLGRVGYAANVDKDGVKDKETTTKTYEIYDYKGKKVFYGTYDAPNCK